MKTKRRMRNYAVPVEMGAEARAPRAATSGELEEEHDAL